MPANVVRIRRSRSQPARSLERTALADAIQKHGEAEGAVAAARARLATANEATAQAETTLASCTAAVATARDQRAAEIAGGSRTATDIKAARTAETDAADHLAAARAAIAATEKAVSQAERNARDTERALDAAIRTVLKAEIPAQKLLDAAEDAQQALVELRLLLRHLDGEQLLCGDLRADIRVFLDHNLEDALPGSRWHASWEKWDTHRCPMRQGWESAAEALRSDPDAELPSV